MLITGLLLFFLSLLGIGMLWNFDRDNYLAEESNRCLNKQCEISSTHNSEEFRRRGYFHSINGLRVVADKDGKKKFIKTCKIIY